MINFEQNYLSKKIPEKNPLEILLADSDLSVRTYQALKNSDIMNLSELVDYIESGLAKNNPGLNQKSLQEIEELLKKHNLGVETDNANG
jgi:DNA-directed RNA polymerase alpha subunit